MGGADYYGIGKKLFVNHRREYMNKIIINKEICNGCKLCFKSCFVDVIKWDAEVKRPVVAYPEDCVQCMVCEANCPQEALRVVEDLPGYRFPMQHVVE